jgi:hypothetical protein
VLDSLRTALRDDVAMRVWPGDGRHLTPVYVDVRAAGTATEALERMQPAVWIADPEARVIVGGTTIMQFSVPRRRRWTPHYDQT